MGKCFKILLSLSLVISLLFSTAYCEFDLSSMGAEELVELISKAETALQALKPLDDSKVLYDRDGLTISIDKIEVLENKDEIKIHLLMINDTNYETRIFFSDVAINSWAVDSHHKNKVKPKTKSRDGYITIEKICELSGIQTFAGIGSIEVYASIRLDNKYLEMHYIMTFVDNELNIISREYN